MSEIIRCCKSGYIETPSPLIEVTKGVCGYIDNEKYAGYLHHRYIIWSDIEKCEIFFLPKYSNILDNFFIINNEKEHYNLVNNHPIYWNNYFIWKEDHKPKITMYKNGVNYNLNYENYINLLTIAIDTSIKNTNYFIKNYL